MELYPIKFSPIFKSKIWGGERLKNVLNKDVGSLNKVGESWELSSVEGNLSIVANGEYAGLTIEELIDQMQKHLVGEKVFSLFGNNFPLLIKYIDANDYLSVQVHPDDEMAKRRHNSFGKTEMWYVVESEKDAELIVGFNQEMDKEKYLSKFDNGELRSILNIEKVFKGDVFQLPAGRVHATGPGILFAEIQQTSDLTYRIYDWDRKDDLGNERELHTVEALDAIDFKNVKEYKTPYARTENVSNEIVSCKYYTTNYLSVNNKLTKDYSNLDSFVILMAVEGDSMINYPGSTHNVALNKGEMVLLPAAIDEVTVMADGASVGLLEVYIDL